MTAPRERPILFSGPMVRAIMSGQKTETRRLVTASTSICLSTGRKYWDLLDFDDAFVDPGPSPAGNPGPYLKVSQPLDPVGVEWNIRVRVYPRTWPGDTLWVRESFALLEDFTDDDPGTRALADGGFYRADYGDASSGEGEQWSRWRPSIHMPRSMCRLRLKVLDVRIERLHDIDDKGAIAEGVDRTNTSIPGYALQRFERLWDKINGKRAPWASNCWVWVIRFDVAS